MGGRGEGEGGHLQPRYQEAQGGGVGGGAAGGSLQLQPCPPAPHPHLWCPRHHAPIYRHVSTRALTLQLLPPVSGPQDEHVLVANRARLPSPPGPPPSILPLSHTHARMHARAERRPPRVLMGGEGVYLTGPPRTAPQAGPQAGGLAPRGCPRRRRLRPRPPQRPEMPRLSRPRAPADRPPTPVTS